MFDIIIIGAGITGSLIAHEFSKFSLKVLVLEKGGDIACGATMANSAIIHSGHDPKPGTLKAKFNVLGNRMYPALCQELQVPYQQIGAFVVACCEEEIKTIQALEQQAKNRDIPVEWLNQEALHYAEPKLSDYCLAAISLPTTGIITPWEVAIAAMEESVLNGVTLKLNEEVIGITTHASSYRVTTSKNEYLSKVIINCAGVYADDVAKMLGKKPRYSITAKRGEYFVLDHLKEPLTTHVLYPVPSEKGKGVLLVPTIHGNTLLGPNSEPVSQKDALENTEELQRVKEKVNRMMKEVPFSEVIRSFSGLRPSGNTHDFVIEEDETFSNFIHVACIESPGLASAPAIAEYVVHTLCLSKFNWKQKENYIHRKAQVKLSNYTKEEIQNLIQQDSRYGKLVCRCEKITEGEICDAIHRPCGATTVKGIKKRVRPGMGRCQGGFCESEITKILARELNLSIQQIMYDGEATPIVKEVL